MLCTTLPAKPCPVLSGSGRGLARAARGEALGQETVRLRPVHFRAGAKIMAKTSLRLVTPDSELRTVTLRRHGNRDMGRDREHLTEHEVERLIRVAKGNRHGHRDATMILIGFRHGLRVSELCDLQWSSIEFQTATIHVRRVKGGHEATHPLLGDELRELKRQSASPFVFASERAGPFTPSGFAKLLARAGAEAKIGFKVHPHMLRHACGYALANKGIDTRTLQAYLGHRSINSTTRYAALAPGRFKNIWGRC
jgi:site-specific recombinase XerD